MEYCPACESKSIPFINRLDMLKGKKRICRECSAELYIKRSHIRNLDTLTFCFLVFFVINLLSVDLFMYVVLIVLLMIYYEVIKYFLIPIKAK